MTGAIVKGGDWRAGHVHSEMVSMRVVHRFVAGAGVGELFNTQEGRGDGVVSICDESRSFCVRIFKSWVYLAEGTV